MLSREFLSEFKRATEARWRDRSPDPNIYGFQFQQGTRWNPGLSDGEIAEYESAFDIIFPDDFRDFLRTMNGTDLPTVNLYGSSGEPHRHSVGVYSYPRDRALIVERIDTVAGYRAELKHTLKHENFELSDQARLVPIFGHRYLVCTSNPQSSTVLSIADGRDAIIYGRSFQEYVMREFL